MLQLHDFSDLVLDEGVAEPDRQALVEDLQRHPRRAQCPVSVPVSVPCFSAPFQCPVSVPVSVPLCPLSRPPQCARLKKARGKARCDPLRSAASPHPMASTRSMWCGPTKRDGMEVQQAGQQAGQILSSVPHRTPRRWRKPKETWHAGGLDRADHLFGCGEQPP